MSRQLADEQRPTLPDEVEAVLVNDGFGDSRYATSILGVPQLPARRLLVMLKATAVD